MLTEAQIGGLVTFAVTAGDDGNVVIHVVLYVFGLLGSSSIGMGT